MFLPLQHGKPIEGLQPGSRRLFVAHLVLVGMNVVGKIPISIAVLGGQTIGIDRRVHRPRMHLHREILVNKSDAVAIFLENFGEQFLMHARAEGTLEVVEIDYDDLRRFGTPRRPAGGIDLAHRVGIRVFA